MEATLGEIRLFAGNFAPRNWVLCQGGLLQITQYQSLYSILGTTYGGDGRTTFGIPDFRGRIVISAGQGTGLAFNHSAGATGGAETVTLTAAQMPAHTHIATTTVNADGTGASTNTPNGQLWASHSEDVHGFGRGQNTTMADGAVVVANAETGGDAGHENVPPFLALNYIMCVIGLFPPRN